MRVAIFRDIKEENWPSMELYADRLSYHLLEIYGEQLGIKTVCVGPLIPGAKGKFLTASIYAARALKYPVVAKLNQGDLNHIIDQTYAHLVHFLDGRRTIVTCHDLAPLALRDILPRRSAGLALWDWALRGMVKAAKVVADSENTRQDILRLTDYPADRIEVIYPGVDRAFSPLEDREALERMRVRMGIPHKAILLHVGHCGQRKNVEGILKALKELVCCYSDSVHFVQIGGVFSRDQRELIGKLDLQAYVTQVNNVEFHDLPMLYNLADVFVFPSLYEGFGFPPLEAMACGTPVVCSNTGSLPETVGDAAIIVSPFDHHGLAAAVVRMLRDSELRKTMIARGLERAKLFTWEECARRTLGVYEEVRAGRI